MDKMHGNLGTQFSKFFEKSSLVWSEVKTTVLLVETYESDYPR